VNCCDSSFSESRYFYQPDLFEPRSVITPLVVEPIIVPMPSCVVGLRREIWEEENGVSIPLLLPLWVGSSGLPSIESALNHDSLEADELCEIMESPVATSSSENTADLYDIPDDYPKALKNLLSSLNEKRKADEMSAMMFLDHLNSRRCRSRPFPYPSRLVRAVFDGDDYYGAKENVDILSTPSALLSMRRSQQELADDLDGLVKKFVFCVPRASSRCPVIDTNTVDLGAVSGKKPLEEMLLEPIDDMLRPFRKAQARLSSSFPDRSLVQFDAGKLQTLAELLRELKRGGHRALIFTQMSKMLDILEAFLNLNGHTYLRLDGSTGKHRSELGPTRKSNVLWPHLSLFTTVL